MMKYMVTVPNAKWKKGDMPTLKHAPHGLGTIPQNACKKYIGSKMLVQAVLPGGRYYIVSPEGMSGTMKVNEDDLTDQMSLNINGKEDKH